MTQFALENVKLLMLFALVGSIIVLSWMSNSPDAKTA